MSLGLLAMESGWHTCVLKYDKQDSTGGCQPGVIGFRIAYCVLREDAFGYAVRNTKHAGYVPAALHPYIDTKRQQIQPFPMYSLKKIPPAITSVI